MNLVRSAQALEDIESCLFWSVENFGVAAAHRYRALLEASLLTILHNPEALGSKPLEGFGGRVRAYHIRHSRKKALVDGISVNDPRHLIVYRTIPTGGIELLRVLHDHMDIDSRIETGLDGDE